MSARAFSERLLWQSIATLGPRSRQEPFTSHQGSYHARVIGRVLGPGLPTQIYGFHPWDTDQGEETAAPQSLRPSALTSNRMSTHASVSTPAHLATRMSVSMSIHTSPHMSYFFFDQVYAHVSLGVPNTRLHACLHGHATSTFAITM